MLRVEGIGGDQRKRGIRRRRREVVDEDCQRLLGLPGLDPRHEHEPRAAEQPERVALEHDARGRRRRLVAAIAGLHPLDRAASRVDAVAQAPQRLVDLRAIAAVDEVGRTERLHLGHVAMLVVRALASDAAL